MRVSAAAISALALLVATDAFVPHSPSFVRLNGLRAKNAPLTEFESLFGDEGDYAQNALVKTARAVNMGGESQAVAQQAKNTLSEFDYLLGEGGEYAQNALITSKRVINTRGDGKAVVQLVSSTTATEMTPVEGFPQPVVKGTGSQGPTEQTEEYDPYSESSGINPVMQKVEVQQNKPGLGGFVAELSFQELVFALIIPSIAAFAGLKWGLNKATGVLEENANEILDNYAREMMYHDGDFEEMKLCHRDYKRRLLLLGPRKKDIMLKHYLQAFAKKMTVTPQSISSLSHVMQMYNLSEEKAAELFVATCKRMGTDMISSVNKLLFFGTRILKSPQGQAALRPIRDIINSTHRDPSTAEESLNLAQKTMGEAAYRHTVQRAGKKQSSLTAGWKVLGLDEETATRIFEDEAEGGFVSDREAMYGGQTTKYDKKGRAIDKDGKLVNPEDGADDDDHEEEEGATGGVFECGECGYTLFVAKGRDFKFFGDDFECPECGAKKDQFVSRDIEE